MRLPARAWRPRAPSRRGRRCRRALCRPPRGRGSGRARGRTPRRSRPPCGKPCPLPPAPLLRAPRRRSCRSPNASEAALASLARRHNATLATSGAEAAKNAPHPCFSNTSHFNPRSPCGERLPQGDPVGVLLQFQPTLPVRGATLTVRSRSQRQSYFNPRSPCGERRRWRAPRRCSDRISTHAPRAGSDHGEDDARLLRPISTHAPRAGSDCVRGGGRALRPISTHAPRAGSDRNILR